MIYVFFPQYFSKNKLFLCFQRLAIELSRHQSKKGASPDGHLSLIGSHGDQRASQHALLRKAANEVAVDIVVENDDDDGDDSSSDSTEVSQLFHGIFGLTLLLLRLPSSNAQKSKKS